MIYKFTKKEVEQVVQVILKNSYFDGEVLKLGKLIEIKPVYEHNLNGNNILVGYDIYRYADEKIIEDEDYNFDADFITTVYKNEE